MTAIEILHETLRSILRNWRQVIQIFLVPLGILIALFVGALNFGTQSIEIDGQTFSVPSPFLFLLFPLVIFLIFWPVVAWHRLLVLNETFRGFLPPFRLKPVLRYVLNLIGLGLILSLVTLPLLGVVGPAMFSEIDPEALIRGEMPPLRFFIWPTLLSLPALYLSIRFCLILPGAAVENHVGFGGSWHYTSEKGIALVLLAILAAIVSLIVQIVLSAITPGLMETNETGFIVIQVGQMIGQLLGSLFVISLMSTIFVAFFQGETQGMR